MWVLEFLFELLLEGLFDVLGWNDRKKGKDKDKKGRGTDR